MIRERMDTADARREERSPEHALPARPTVLLVDSYDTSRRALGAFLAEHGYRVLEARNGVEGLRVVREQVPTLIIVELWPFFSASLQMVERVRRGRGTAHVPVLVVTSAVRPEYRARALAAGCEGYLEKPCEPGRVLASVRRVLAAAEPRPPEGRPVRDDPVPPL